MCASRLLFFNGDFGRFNYRKNLVAFFEVHALHWTSGDN